MTTHSSAGDVASSLEAADRSLRRKADRAAWVARQYRKGEEGEQRSNELLSQLGAGFFVLADRSLPDSAGNIDHVVIGPPGVFVIDTKNWSGTVEIDGLRLRHDRRRRDREVEAIRAQAVLVAEILDEASLPAGVRPLLCFAGEARIGGHKALDRVHLVDAESLVDFIKTRSVALTGSEVEARLRLLSDRLPPRAAVDRQAMTPVPPVEPSEALVFIEPWRKAGRNRLYVKSSGGKDVGYLDLANGEVHPADAEWERALGRLLPHFVKGDTPGDPASDMSDSARGRMRRMIDLLLGRDEPQAAHPPLLAAYHWRGRGASRLYLHRIDSRGVKTQLGWYDLHKDRYGSDQPDVAGHLAFCAQRFRELRSQAPNTKHTGPSA